MKRFLTIADDLTGANDTGVQFTKRGIPTEVIFDSRAIIESSSIVIDTESRNETSSQAYDKVKRMVATILDNHSFDLVYKKVDSTLRGNIAMEVKAIDELYQPERIIFAPAYPDNNRTTVNGVHHVDGVPLRYTEFARDPQKPILEDRLQKIMMESLGEDSYHFDLDSLYRKEELPQNPRLFSFDVSENADLRRIVRMALKAPKRTFWVGSAGLANAILDELYPAPPVLAMAGSVSDITRMQVEYASSNGLQLIRLDMASMIKDEQMMEAIVAETLESLKNGQDTLLSSALGYEDLEKTLEAGRERGIAYGEISRYVQHILGEITHRVIGLTDISGLFLTGGDTAAAVFQSLQASGSVIIEEILPGIPMAVLKGGPYGGLKVITKAGAFGSRNAIISCAAKLKERRI
ncbi:MAG: four-carbon acid sugar kinase family protein [Clostridia bacterium]|jgi:uncharacterized protein YgbK (DUF1537 family)